MKEKAKRETNDNLQESGDSIISKEKVFIILLLIILLLLIGLVFGTKLIEYLNRRKTGGVTINQAGYFVEKAAELISGEKVDAGNNFTIAGYGKITMNEGELTAKVKLRNPEENTDLFYLRFEIVLKDSGELLYKSDLLEPGMEIKEANLTRTFEKGDYEAMVKVTPIMIDDPEASCNIMAYSTTLHVE